VFYDQLKQLCELNNTSISQILVDFKMSSSNVTNWKKGIAPNSKTLEKIATYFNISTDYLLGKESPVTASIDIKLNEIEYALFNEIKDMDEETKKEMLDYAKYKKQQKFKG
jgi:transcriptional regulator with XRE-family HTH domain